MYTTIKFSLFALLVALFGMASPVFAVEEPVTTQAETTQTEDTTTETTEAETKTTVEDKKKTVEERLQAYKEKQTEKLAEAQAKRIQTKCKSAQAKVTTLRARVTTIVENRTSAYEKIDTKITELLEKLQKAGVDTKTYETAREDVAADLANLAESMEAYGLVLDDIIAMDCESDPDAFKAALESARDTQKELRTMSAEFRSFATTQLKTVLQEVRTQLEALKTTDTSTTEEAGGTE